MMWQTYNKGYYDTTSDLYSRGKKGNTSFLPLPFWAPLSFGVVTVVTLLLQASVTHKSDRVTLVTRKNENALKSKFFFPTI